MFSHWTGIYFVDNDWSTFKQRKLCSGRRLNIWFIWDVYNFLSFFSVVLVSIEKIYKIGQNTGSVCSDFWSPPQRVVFWTLLSSCSVWKCRKKFPVFDVLHNGQKGTSLSVLKMNFCVCIVGLYHFMVGGLFVLFTFVSYWLRSILTIQL